jgi:hypothetical protein
MESLLTDTRGVRQQQETEKRRAGWLEAVAAA